MEEWEEDIADTVLILGVVVGIMGLVWFRQLWARLEGARLRRAAEQAGQGVQGVQGVQADQGVQSGQGGQVGQVEQMRNQEEEDERRRREAEAMLFGPPGI